MYCRSTLFLLFGCCCNFLQAQNDTLSVRLDTATIVAKIIDQNVIDSFKNDADFDYETVETTAPDWWIATKNWAYNLFLRFFEWLFGVEQASGAFNVFLKILPYVLLVVLVFILIKFFINVNARAISYAQKNKTVVTLSEEEHIIKNEDIQKLIQQALAAKNYRLAVRYYYLYILQLMDENGIIVWELQKTNTDYNRELEKIDLKKPFATITRLYEYIWYGDFPIDENKYLKAEATFLSLKKDLQDG